MPVSLSCAHVLVHHNDSGFGCSLCPPEDTSRSFIPRTLCLQYTAQLVITISLWCQTVSPRPRSFRGVSTDQSGYFTSLSQSVCASTLPRPAWNTCIMCGMLRSLMLRLGFASPPTAPPSINSPYTQISCNTLTITSGVATSEVVTSYRTCVFLVSASRLPAIPSVLCCRRFRQQSLNMLTRPTSCFPVTCRFPGSSGRHHRGQRNCAVPRIPVDSFAYGFPQKNCTLFQELVHHMLIDTWP